jgi:hypothetical protein
MGVGLKWDCDFMKGILCRGLIPSLKIVIGRFYTDHRCGFAVLHLIEVC